MRDRRIAVDDDRKRVEFVFEEVGVASRELAGHTDPMPAVGEKLVQSRVDDLSRGAGESLLQPTKSADSSSSTQRSLPSRSARQARSITDQTAESSDTAGRAGEASWAEAGSAISSPKSRAAITSRAAVDILWYLETNTGDSKTVSGSLVLRSRGRTGTASQNLVKPLR